MKFNSVKDILENRVDLREKLFYMGFYATTQQNDFLREYPFYNLWRVFKVSDLNVYVHPKQFFYKLETDEIDICLIGHAYDPINNISDEEKILKNLISSKEYFFNKICVLTGIYTIIWKYKNSDWNVLNDACGIQTTFYSNFNNHIHISSHDNLLGDIFDLNRDEYIERLVDYKFFGLLGAALPGDLSQFKEVKRVVPNHYVKFDNKLTVMRYHIPEVKNFSYEEIVKFSSEILHNNLMLITQKWKNPAISMTGGCDSKTTLACANGLYENFDYFSYVSSESEALDADAANTICKNILNNKEHKIYHISENDSDFIDIELHREILFHNQGGLRKNNKNDVRKRCFFSNINDFDVEVKSWVSEVGRAYYSKRFNNRTKFPSEPTGRLFTTLYKFFFHNRKLVKETDKVFKEYLKKYFVKSSTIPWQEQFFWEYRVPSWNGLVITGEHRYSFDITIPYNNCYLLELLLSVPLKDRISDKLYADIRAYMNDSVDKLGISIQNLKHTKNRARLENIYFSIHSKLPF